MLKKIIQEGSASNFARGSNVPDSSTKTLTLKPNSHYQSSEFSGTGWRFGGYFLKLHRVQEHIYDGQVTKMQVE